MIGNFVRESILNRYIKNTICFLRKNTQLTENQIDGFLRATTSTIAQANNADADMISELNEKLKTAENKVIVLKNDVFICRTELKHLMAEYDRIRLEHDPDNYFEHDAEMKRADVK